MSFATRSAFALFATLVSGAAVAAPADGAAASPGAAVVSDVAPLRSVIVLPPGPDLLTVTWDRYVDEPFGGTIYADGATAQHQSLVALLRANGVDVLDLRDLLQNAIDNARRAGELERELAAIFPEQGDDVLSLAATLTAEQMLGRDAALFYHYAPSGYLDPRIPASPGFFYTRDFAVSTPRGVILTNSRSRHRRWEHAIGRFLFRWADRLREHPVAFDAEREGVRCEGGDILVADEHTLLMGIGNLSDRAAAAAIAKKLGLEVIGVAMPSLEAFSGANVEILHLDTVFNFVDRRHVLTVPYLFLREYDGRNPLVDFLAAIQARPPEEARPGELVFPLSLARALGTIPKVGWLTRFAAGTGEATELGTKLGDWARARGYEIVPVGGDRDAMPEDRYLNECVLYELSLQAANVVQLAPGKVLAYRHNAATIAALEARGVTVLSFDGKYLADMYGGPHCLTMPLERPSF